MCGRMALAFLNDESLTEKFGIPEAPDLHPRYNIAPSQWIAAVRFNLDRRTREFAWLRWGFVPSWSKDPTRMNMINARAETVTEKPAFKGAFRYKRCLIPADGFYEWKAQGSGRKVPYHITLKTGGLFAFAGIWDTHVDENADLQKTCAIITTTPNELMSEIHNRMPVILAEKDYAAWLEPGKADLNHLKSLLKPFPSTLMQAREISLRVNSASNDDAGVLAPPEEQD